MRIPPFRSARIRITGIGITENISNFQNTPDIGVHLQIGIVVPI